MTAGGDVRGDLLDLGFYEAFDRPFDPLSDPGYVGSGLDLLQSALGGLGASRGPGRDRARACVGAVAAVRLGGAAHRS